MWLFTGLSSCPSSLFIDAYSLLMSHGSSMRFTEPPSILVDGSWDAFLERCFNGSYIPSSQCTYILMISSFPPAYFWQQYNQSLGTPLEGSCGVNNAALVISSAALNTAGDIAVFALPIAMLAQLNLRRSHKVALIALFTTGAL